MSLSRFDLGYFCLLLLSISTAVQFDYFFFNISFFVPFFVALIVFTGTVLLYASSLKQLLFLLFFVLCVTFFLLFFSFINTDDLKRAVLYPGFIILFVYTANKLLCKMKGSQLRSLVIATLVSGVVAVAVETIYRFSFPLLDLPQENASYINDLLSQKSTLKEMILNQHFYAYKYSSIMFFDSNFVALFLLPLLILALFCLQSFKPKRIFRVLIVIILILILLTFSRSAIITSWVLVYFYFLYHLLRTNKHVFVLVFFLSILFGIVGLSYFISLLSSDSSFGTKLDILASMKSIVDHDLKNILFGFGVDRGEEVYSYREGAYAHSLIPLLLGQFGIVGVVLFLSVFIYLGIKIGFFGWLLFFSILLSGFSLADPWQILNYYPLLLMLQIKNYHNRN